MRLVFSVLLLLASSVLADDRISMVGPPEEDEAIKQLLAKVSKSCSESDFRGFMDCFTPSKAASIRQKAEHAFICGKVDFDVQDFFVISAGDEFISFGLRYYMTEGDSPKVMYCSKMIAKKCDDSWRIDYEHIRNRSSTASKQIYAVANPAQQQQRLAPNNGQAKGWRPPNPANGGEEAWLPKDILYMPGPSCANGNCRR